jgi:hypothetical protein
MLGFLSSALGGTILGKVLSFGDKWFESYTHRKNAEVDILKAKALSELKIKEEELKAFTTSQQSANEDSVGIPAQAAPWAANLAVAVDSFRRFTRPALTWALAAVISLLAFRGNLDPVTRTALVSDLVFTAATALTWWFGSRPKTVSTK